MQWCTIEKAVFHQWDSLAIVLVSVPVALLRDCFQYAITPPLISEAASVEIMTASLFQELVVRVIHVWLISTSLRCTTKDRLYSSHSREIVLISFA